MDYVASHFPEVEVQVPALSHYPSSVAQQLTRLMEAQVNRPIGVIGSSLGGFYASWLSARYGCRSVLVNPAVRPYALPNLLGDHQNPYTGECFSLQQSHLDELKTLDLPAADPSLMWLMVQTDDETLDYRQAVAKYAQSPQLVETGGDHSFIGFDRHLPAIMEFLQRPVVAA